MIDREKIEAEAMRKEAERIAREKVSERLFGLVSHHVNPKVGWIRLDDSNGAPYRGDALLDQAYSETVESILKDLALHGYIRLDDDGEPVKL